MSRKRSTRREGRPTPESVKPAAKPSLLGDFAGLVIPSAICVAAFSSLFDPIGWWPLTFVCLFPWAASVIHTHRAWLAHLMSFAAGSAFFLINLRWLMPVTGPGSAALALYMAVYWLLAGWGIRSAWRRRIPLTVSLPIVWVATEFLRGIVLSGFPWFFLGHGLYEILTLIQISDIVGAYGVTVLAAAVNGFIADMYLMFLSRPKAAPPLGRMILPASVVVLTVAFTVAYGTFRLRTSTFEKGPLIAVIQEDFPLNSDPRLNAHGSIIFAANLRLAADAALHKPDIIVFPETPWGGVQNLEFVSVKNNAVQGISVGRWQYGIRYHQATSAFARGDYAAVNRIIRDFARVPPRHAFPQLPESGGPPVTVVLGSVAVETYPEDVYPRVKKFNSALVYDRDGVQRPERYDKTHLVPFGEQVPFRYGRLRWLYLWFNSLSPFSGPDGTYEYSLTPGSEFTAFQTSHDSRSLRFGTPICYEDVTPDVIRRYVWDGSRRRIDFLINISNDGWFLYSAELPQHFAIAVFRAVENRIGMARAVNTGISGFIDPNGKPYSLVADGAYGPGVVGYSVDHVLLDQRGSLYGRFGDWFAWTCVGLAGVTWLDALVSRFRRRRRQAREATG